MENTHESLESLFADIADAIRAQSGDDKQVSADCFPAEIDALIDNTLLLSIIEGSITELPSEILEGVKHIGEAAFMYSKIENLIVPGNIKRIGDQAFYNSSALISVILLQGVAYIGRNAFQFCNELTTVTLSNTVTEIDYSAFGECIKLTDVYYTGTEEEWSAINIHTGNECLTSANLHYDYVAEDMQ